MAYRQNNYQGQNDRVRFDLMERIGVLNRKDNGWTREVNIVAWNDGPAKVDIREWDPDHKRMTKGVTLFEDEAEKLAEVLARRYGLFYTGSGQHESFSDDRSKYTGKTDGFSPQGRTFGELTGSPRERSYHEPAGEPRESAIYDMAGASAGEAAEAAAGQSESMDTAPAAAAASMDELTAAFVAEDTAETEAAAPALA